MKREWLIWACWILLLSACTPSPDTSGRIWVGVRLAKDCHTHTWVPRLPSIQDIGLTGLMIEVAVDPADPGPAGGYQYYLPHALDTLIPKLNKAQIDYGIHIELLDDTTKVSYDRLEEWFTELSGLLLRSSSYPPQWLMFSGPWTKDGWRSDALRGFIQNARSGWKPFQGEIWFAAERLPAPGKQDNAKPAPDAWVRSIKGYPTKKDISSLRAIRSFHKTDKDPEPMPFRVLHSSSSWAGVQGRIKQWMTPANTTHSPEDLFLSGTVCDFPLSDKEVRKLRKWLAKQQK